MAKRVLMPLAVIGLTLLLAACGDASACREGLNPGWGAAGGQITGGETGIGLASQPLGGDGGDAISDATSPNSSFGPYPCY